MSQHPQTRTFPFPGPPQEAYAFALQAFVKMGGQPQALDAQTRLIAGTVHGAVYLTVTIDPQSVIQVTGHLVPGKMVMGSLTEVDDYLALLQQEVVAQRAAH
jgi:hypothetical protein